MIIRFHKTVVRQKLNDGTKQVVQTVDKVSMFDDQIAKARSYLESRGIKDLKPVYQVRGETIAS